MKKYIVTSKHPYLKDGIKFDQIGSSMIIPYDINGDSEHETTIEPSREMIKLWLNAGYIKEVEEKEFTKSDMKIRSLEFAKYLDEEYIKRYDDPNKDFSEVYDDWLKDEMK